MRMEDLRYLVQVADYGSINLAAEACFITQQGLSRIISNIEKELGIQLFYRNNNRIQLTSVGELVVARARELNGLYQHMLNDISRDTSSLEGQPPVDYHIYTTQLVSATFLFRVLSSLNLRYPGIHLDVEELTPPEIADQVDFTSNSIGIISISSFHEAASLRLKSGELAFERYFQDELMLGVAEHSPLAKKKCISAQELSTIPLAICSNESMMVRELLEPGMEPAVALHISSHELCREMVSRNRAAGLTSVLRNYYSQCPMKSIELERTIKISYGCIYNPRMPMTPFIADLLSMVSQELKHVR